KEKQAPVRTITEPYMAVPANQNSRPAAEKPSGTIIRSIGKYGFRAAACILVIASSTVIYKYVTISSNSLYGRYFDPYSLNTSRGEATEAPIVQAYNSKDWSKVLAL